MEAIAKHDFNATADDELSFRKNQILKVNKTIVNLWNFVYYRIPCGPSASKTFLLWSTAQMNECPQTISEDKSLN